jgi:hypothetical protein
MTKKSPAASANPFLRIKPALIKDTAEAAAHVVGGRPPVKLGILLRDLPYWDEVSGRRGAQGKLLRRKGVGETLLLFNVRAATKKEREGSAGGYQQPLYQIGGGAPMDGGSIYFSPARPPDKIDRPSSYFNTAEHELGHLLQYVYSDLLGLWKPPMPEWRKKTTKAQRRKARKAKAAAAAGDDQFMTRGFGFLREPTGAGLTGPIEMAPSIGSQVRGSMRTIFALNRVLGTLRLPPLTRAEVDKLMALTMWTMSYGHPPALRKKITQAGLRGWENWAPRQWKGVGAAYQAGLKERQQPASTFLSSLQGPGFVASRSYSEGLRRAEDKSRIPEEEAVPIALYTQEIVRSRISKDQKTTANPKPRKHPHRKRRPRNVIHEQHIEEGGAGAGYHTPRKPHPKNQRKKGGKQDWRREVQENPRYDERLPAMPEYGIPAYRDDTVYDPREESIRAVARGSGRFGIAVGHYAQKRGVHKVIERSWQRYQDPDKVLRDRQKYELMLSVRRWDNSGPYRVTKEVTKHGLRYFVWPMYRGQRKPTPHESAGAAEDFIHALYGAQKRPAEELPSKTYTKRELTAWLPPEGVFEGRLDSPPTRAPQRPSRKRTTPRPAVPPSERLLKFRAHPGWPNDTAVMKAYLAGAEEPPR